MQSYVYLGLAEAAVAALVSLIGLLVAVVVPEVGPEAALHHNANNT